MISFKRTNALTAAAICVLGASCTGGLEESELEANELSRAAHCQNLPEDACHANTDCAPIYAAADENAASPNAATYVGCGPSGECLLDFVCTDGSLPQGPSCECPLGCENVLCAPGHHCIEAPSGPTCTPICTDAAGCWCVVDEATAYAPGTTFPAPDGCNTCYCDQSGQISCTEAACECPLDFVCPDGSNPVGPNCECPPSLSCSNVRCRRGHHCVETNAGPTCVPDCNDADPNACVCPTVVCWDGSTPSGSDCACPPNPTCADVQCQAGQTCVETDASGPQCVPCAEGQACGCANANGDQVPPGTSFPAPDGCNTCYCDANGQISCTEVACECPLDFICPDGSNPVGPSCECPSACNNDPNQACYCVTPDGNTMPVGTTFTSADGCNTCICNPDGQVACTEIACSNGG